MQLKKPHQLTSAYPTPEIIETAKAEYMRQWNGLNAAMVRHGIEKLRNARIDWLPDPVEFAEDYCRISADDLGMPKVRDAWLEACNHSHEPISWSWSHEAVRLAGRTVGWSALQGYSDEPQTKREFEHAYQTLINRAVNGEEITGRVSKALEDLSRLDPIEATERHNTQQLSDTMRKQGINPEGGRAEFLKTIKGL